MKLTEIKRKDILDAAIEEFREQGFAAARVNRIAELAGVSKRTLYKHFESKEQLFAAITDKLLEETAAMPKLQYQPEVDLRQQLLKAMWDYVGRLTGEDYLGLSRLVLSELLRDQELAKAFMEKAASQDAPLTGLIAAAMEADALKKADPVFATNQLSSMVKHFLVWPAFLSGKPSSEHAEHVIAECVDMFLARYSRKG